MAAPIAGVLLAAGAGRRAGGPKALRIDPDQTPWLVRSVEVLLAGGCNQVFAVLGDGAPAAVEILAAANWSLATEQAITVVTAADWAAGMGASLRAGLLAVEAAPVRAVLVHLVDLPDVGADVVRRVLQDSPAGTNGLTRAAYAGRPGHPVLIGHDHLRALIVELAGDRGAREYLARQGTRLVECGDLATGEDRDGDQDEVE